MTIFILLLTRLIPLYVVIALGFFAARKLKVDRESVSKIVYYILVPMVFFHGTYHTPVSLRVLSLPLLAFVISTVLCLAFYRIGRRFYIDSNANVLAMAAGNGNTGYFGLPVALMLFDQATVGTYIVLMIGVAIYESTVGFYVTARGHHTTQEALAKLLRLPALYGFAFGVIFNALHIPLPGVIDDFLGSVRSSYSILGMMIIGLALASIRSLKLDWLFMGICFLGRFVGWPLLGIGFVYLDAAWWGFYPKEIHNCIILLSIVPMAANTVIIADLLGAEPEKAAAAVFLSTLLALFSVPLLASLFIIN